jgi:hypothetical protein
MIKNCRFAPKEINDVRGRFVTRIACSDCRWAGCGGAAPAVAALGRESSAQSDPASAVVRGRDLRSLRALRSRSGYRFSALPRSVGGRVRSVTWPGRYLRDRAAGCAVGGGGWAGAERAAPAPRGLYVLVTRKVSAKNRTAVSCMRLVAAVVWGENQQEQCPC